MASFLLRYISFIPFLYSLHQNILRILTDLEKGGGTRTKSTYTSKLPISAKLAPSFHQCIVPYLMYRLHSNKQFTNSHTFKAAFIEFIAYQVFNFVIMRVFLYSPFVSSMDNTGRMDRFTW